MHSFESHKFLFKYLDSISADTGKDGPIEHSLRQNDKVLTLSHDPDLGLMITESSSRTLNATDRMLSTTRKCSQYKGLDDYELCIMHHAHGDLEGALDETTIARDSAKRMSSRLRNYTCSDIHLDTSPALYSTSFSSDDRDAISYTADVLMDNTNAKIWLVHDMITAEECEALRVYGGPKLKRATVSDGTGGHLVSEARKAQQARYHFNATHPRLDYLYPLFKKIFRITNEFTGFQLDPAGQEEFMVIQYNKHDQYTPHCDGGCDGGAHAKGGRVATAVLYCETATVGGGTTFTKSDIFVKPKDGMGAFFSYKGADGNMDDGYTEHSGCPVVEGEKWISTVWMREGVTAEIPHSVYDPTGLPIDG